MSQIAKHGTTATAIKNNATHLSLIRVCYLSRIVRVFTCPSNSLLHVFCRTGSSPLLLTTERNCYFGYNLKRISCITSSSSHVSFCVLDRHRIDIPCCFVGWSDPSENMLDPILDPNVMDLFRRLSVHHECFCNQWELTDILSCDSGMNRTLAQVTRTKEVPACEVQRTPPNH
jgi:hypothetical protein